ncbi:hypothetical protein H4Q26_008193 [Puccinia striiformis f. sp. tritici PST-130]|nr:hypothetical protein H4Q26_008193 [Puccinia striiformis f. sp. tritici PST-130]
MVWTTPKCQTFSLSARSKQRRAGRKRAGELGKHRFNPALNMNIHYNARRGLMQSFSLPSAPKLEATKSHQDGLPVNQTAKTLAHRIVDPKVEAIRKLASRITDALVADISNVRTNEDDVWVQ